MNNLRVELTAVADDRGLQWSARINGAEYPIASFAVEPGTDGPMLALTFTPSSITVGDPSPSGQPAAVREAAPAKPLSTWGSPGRPDPREHIPGWQPETLGGQATANAQAVHQ